MTRTYMITRGARRHLEKDKSMNKIKNTKKPKC